ncbi:two-component regulator propeller domain-containing protein [Flammeovirga sp. EKP202]|uniref:two-component regulator propeller domain-containing protein n=1 Tax=Flammeovirga sp. EKP202 TaxID=2770592 RepID=UPI00165F2441|nr:two-component regulator propeller domain-containing protein [Flammeovirga sp. EKP202]MBD0402408.1 SpoIIE family protein phosphatase [Flammeovirga sp. EKP202]
MKLTRTKLLAFASVIFIMIGFSSFKKVEVEKNSIAFFNTSKLIKIGYQVYVPVVYHSPKKQFIHFAIKDRNNEAVGYGGQWAEKGKHFVTVPIQLKKGKKLQENQGYSIECFFIEDQKKWAPKKLIQKYVIAKKEIPYHLRHSNTFTGSEWDDIEGDVITNNEENTFLLKMKGKASATRQIPVQPYKYYKLTFNAINHNPSSKAYVALKGSQLDNLMVNVNQSKEQEYSLIFKVTTNAKVKEVSVIASTREGGDLEIKNIAVTPVLVPWIKRMGLNKQQPAVNSLKFFEHVTTEDGLSQNSIPRIFQDEQGFMWFGTYDGLNKYDGYSFQVYKKASQATAKQSISSNLIYAIDEDADGNLWIGTSGGGLSMLNQASQEFTVYQHNSDDPESISNDHVTDLHIDTKNRLWITHLKGIDMLDLNLPVERRKFISMDLNSSDKFPKKVTCVYETTTGELWFGANAQVAYHLIDESDDNFIFETFKTTGVVNVIKEDKNGKLIMGSNSGLNIEYKDKETGKKYFCVPFYTGVNAMEFTDNKETLWVATRNGLIEMAYNKKGELKFKARYQENIYNEHSLNNNDISSLYKDRQGTLWIGTIDGGVNKLDVYRKPFRHINKTGITGGLLENSTRGLLYDSEGGLWVGTGADGLNYLPPHKDYNQFQQAKDVAKLYTIIEVNCNGKKKIWLGTRFGLLVTDLQGKDGVPLEKRLNKIDFEFSSIMVLFQDSRGIIWVGTYSKGLFKVDDNLNLEEVVQLPTQQLEGQLSSEIIRSVQEDSFGNIWVGTADGLNMIPADQVYDDNPTVVVYKNEENNSHSLSQDYILDLLPAEDGDLWVGTMGGGLNKFVAKENKFIKLATSNGLPNNTVKGILEDRNNHIWVSTNNGLARIDKETLEITDYDRSDGLQGNEFQDLSKTKTADGLLLFGGVNGITMFDPTKITDNTMVPSIVFTNFKLFNKMLNVGDSVNGEVILEKNISLTNSLVLDHDEKNFSLEFAALHYASPLKNQYSYKLEGFDKDWFDVSAENRWVNYTNLDAGEYTFMVKGSNNDGTFNEEVKEMKITILPPWWETTWFRILVTILLIIFAIAFYQYKVYAYKKSKKLLQRLVKERTVDLQSAHDEIMSNNAKLEEQHEELEMQRESLLKKNDLITETNNKLIDSIRYAKTIQKAILPSERELRKAFNKIFNLYLPKDLVSGDFVWLHQEKRHTYFVVADCTGHGVPGGFMSMIGSSILNNLIREQKIDDVSVILNKLHEKVYNAFRHDDSFKDAGMDLIICKFTPQGGLTILEFAGAKTPLYHYDSFQKEITVYPTTKKSIGSSRKSDVKFEKNILTILPEDCIYLASDGYMDQNKADRKKFGRVKFLEMLNENSQLDFTEQLKNIEQELDTFKEGEEQRDDITVVGIGF